MCDEAEFHAQVAVEAAQLESLELHVVPDHGDDSGEDQEKYESHEAAREGLATELRAFYEENYPEMVAEKGDLIEAAGTVLGDIYTVNNFPQMEVWWDTYPNHIGHEQSDGCLRCHKRSMRTEDREQVSNDCDTCHLVLAEEEESPQIFSALD